MAYRVRKPGRGLIFHSDKGSQYASAEVRRWLAERGIRQSMSGTGNCFDNAPTESFWHSLKVEETHGQEFATRAQAKHCVFAYIEGRYNTTRMHSSLGYKSPAPFERICDTTSIKAANDNPINALPNDSQSARLTQRAAQTLNEKLTGSPARNVFEARRLEIPSQMRINDAEQIKLLRAMSGSMR